VSAAVLLARLEGVKKTGHGRWIAKCPAHKDRSPSLSVRELDDGRVLLHDHAGCKVEEVLGAVGLTFCDLFPDRSIEHARPEQKPWRVRDVVVALEFELTLALIYLAAIHEGRVVVADRERAGECRERIVRFIEELRHAS
jgi:hypothetical protein